MRRPCQLPHNAKNGSSPSPQQSQEHREGSGFKQHQSTPQITKNELLIFSFEIEIANMNSTVSGRQSHKSTKSSRSTDLDSSFESTDPHPLPPPCKLKTELCKTYSLLGYCNYGEKCRFAHGMEELVRVGEEAGQKSRKCNGFWRKGNCAYGVRCQFGHARLQWQDRCCLLALETLVSGGLTSKLLPLLH